eukprot:TRINITY_DN6176_c0_g1_i1.p1 TRINITY_DN6176_c0_g1~~TRINITY_DN6176_c0_g1_i1.p1  ORF type:complete len:106 (-),score=46.14 TRINITY_DN6176_c0_g1_i1:111-428(-)
MSGIASLLWTYCCGQECTLCCFLFSTWGAIFMAVIGALLSADYEGVDPANAINPEYREDAATNTYISAGIYGVLAIVCLARYSYIQFTGGKVAVDSAYKHQEDEL